MKYSIQNLINTISYIHIAYISSYIYRGVSSESQYTLQREYILQYILERVYWTGYVVGDSPTALFKKMRFVLSVSLFIPSFLRKFKRESRLRRRKNAKLEDFCMVEWHYSLLTAPRYGNYPGYGSYPPNWGPKDPSGAQSSLYVRQSLCFSVWQVVRVAF